MTPEQDRVKLIFSLSLFVVILTIEMLRRVLWVSYQSSSNVRIAEAMYHRGGYHKTKNAQCAIEDWKPMVQSLKTGEIKTSPSTNNKIDTDCNILIQLKE